MTEFFVTERQAGYQQTQKGKAVYATLFSFKTASSHIQHLPICVVHA